jgi:peptidoglycan pentaglycine glycine transferase (the first glycine)
MLEVHASNKTTPQRERLASNDRGAIAQTRSRIAQRALVPSADHSRRLLDDRAWDTFVLCWPRSHMLQTSHWAALKSRFRWKSERIALVEDGSIVGGAQVLFRPLPAGLSMAYVPRGPLVDWSNWRQVQALFSAIRRAARPHRAFGLTIEPDLESTSELLKTFDRLGLRPSNKEYQPRSTILVDLTASEDRILARMKSKCRYNIRRAQREGVVVRDGTAADLPAFQRILEETASRQSFRLHSPDYYRAVQEELVAKGQARLLLAFHEERLLAGIVVTGLGRKACYLYGGSGNAHRNLMPNYLLQWEAIKWAKRFGCESYDLWGIPDEIEGVLEQEFASHKGGMWGVYRFKRGFGGQVVRYVGAYDQVYSRGSYWMGNSGADLLMRVFGETWHRCLRRG